MTTHIDAIIAALEVAHGEAEASEEMEWDVVAANRWVALLPGTALGRWRTLKLRGDEHGQISRERFLSHVRATLAYLEINRDAIAAMKPWSLRFRPAAEPPTDPHSGSKSKPSLRVVD